MSFHSDIAREVVLCTDGDQSLVDVDVLLYELTDPADPTTLTWNIDPGQLGLFKKSDLTSVDVAGLPAAAAVLDEEFFLAVGIDTDGDGNTDDVILGPRDHFALKTNTSTRTNNIMRYTEKEYNASVATEVHLLFDCTFCDQEYSFQVEVQDMKYRQYFGPQRFPIDYYNIKTDCCGCTDCTSEHNCEEIVTKFIEQYDLKAKEKSAAGFSYPFYTMEAIPALDPALTVDDVTYTCGIKITGQIDLRNCNGCNPNTNQVRNQGSIINIFPKEGWSCGGVLVNPVTAMELAEGRGDWITWREIYSNQSGRGRAQQDYYYDSPDWIDADGYTSLKDSGVCCCTCDYNQAILDLTNPDRISFNESVSDNDLRVLIAIPTGDTTTWAEWQALAAAIIAL